MTPPTGNDVANMHQAAEAEGFGWCTAPSLPSPYVVDHDARRVWLDGRLGVEGYYTALAEGMAELRGDDGVVIPLDRGERLRRDRGTG